MAKINAIGNATGSLTVDPGAAGDSTVQFSIAGTPEFIIGCDDTDDSFRISNGNALGTTDYFVMSAAGERTMPLQPAFLAKLDSALSDVTGDGTNYGPIIWDGEIFDQNADYDNSNGTFSAPVAGVYALTVCMAIEDLTDSHTRGTYVVPTSNGLFYINDLNIGAARNSANDYRGSNGIIADMDAADTTTVSLLVNGGTKVVDIVGDASTPRYSFFAGYLVC